jgi:flagellar basal-body rod protein FlgB
MLISDLSNSGALPVLKTAVRFASARTPLLVNNIANASTPDFRPSDVAPSDFRASLSEAVERRRRKFGSERGELDIRSSRGVEVGAGGRLSLRPREQGRNILFHDRNDRDLERMMQDLVENSAAHRVAIDLLKSRYDLMRSAISERVS